MFILLPVWPCQKPVDKTRRKANTCTKNNFDIWSTTKSSKVDAHDQNIKTIRLIEVCGTPQRCLESPRFLASSKFALMEHFTNLKLVRPQQAGKH